MKTLVIAALSALIFCVLTFSAQAGCVRTEQAYCIEIDILNLDSSPLLDIVASSGRNDRGAVLYQQYTGGGAQSAGNGCYFVYVWNPAMHVSATEMSQYHIRGRSGRDPYRTSVTEVDSNSGPSFRTEYSIGQPQRAFRVCGDEAVMAFQFPYELVGSNTYILVCFDGRTVVPGSDLGEWLTPTTLNQMVRHRHEYVFTPFTR